MTSEELVELLADRPFRPLRIHISNGRAHEIRHPEMAIVGEDVAAIGVESGNGNRPRIRLVSISHITEVKPLAESLSADS